MTRLAAGAALALALRVPALAAQASVPVIPVPVPTLAPPLVPAPTAQPKPVSLSTDLGFVQTSGNTDVSTLSVGEKLGVTGRTLGLRQVFSVVYGRSNGVTNASLWRAGLTGTYAFSSQVGLYALATWERNTFAGIARRFEEGVGATFVAVTGQTDHLDLAAGVSIFQQRAVEVPSSTPDRYTAARGTVTYRHRFHERASFGQVVEVLPNLDVTEDLRLNTETTLAASVSRRVAVKLSYVVRFDNLPEPGLRKTDRVLTSGLQLTL